MAVTSIDLRLLRPVEEVYGFGWETDAECQEYAVHAYASDRLGQVFALAADETRELDGLIEQLREPADRASYRRQWSEFGGYTILAERAKPHRDWSN